MFTGIVQDLGRLVASRPRGPGRRLSVATGLGADEALQLGESVAVNGVCLTVAATAAGAFEADVSPETLQRSNLGRLRPGEGLNLERALRPLDRLGGHFVLGHVDAVGKLESRRRDGDFWVLRFGAPAALTRYLVEKGSVAVDGVSLTVAQFDSAGFSVAVIPHTLERTNLASRGPGEPVNLEGDVLAKYVERLLGGTKPGPGLTLEALAGAGFLK